MATKSITITEEAYERLKAHKREGESFTDVVNRLAATNTDPLDAAGNWPGLGETLEEDRKELDRDLRERENALY